MAPRTQSHENETPSKSEKRSFTDDESQISSAVYPISQPLAVILRVALIAPSPTNNNSATSNASVSSKDVDAKAKVERESMEAALEHFIRNSFVAMDSLFFSTPPSKRKKASFQHRLCIRISTSLSAKSLTITDLGTGMTRSDLINSLGVGSRLSANALQVVRALESSNSSAHNAVAPLKSTEEEFEYDSGNGNDYVDTCSSSSKEYESEDDGKALHIQQCDADDVDEMSEKRNMVVPCKAEDIGGFYAALCALGVGVEIGTKSKFDDYYEFKLHRISSNKDNSQNSTTNDFSTKDFSHFSITRPMKEGIQPSSFNGFDGFSDLRGESGTRVTLSLSDRAVDAGFLDEERILKPLLEKILETSPYRVVLERCCTKEEKANLIDANQKEKESDKYEEELDVDSDEDITSSDLQVMSGSQNTVKERSKYIPLRLSMGERKMLRVVEAAMTCCDYTTEVDKPFKSIARRTHAQLKGVTSVLRGMVTACDYAAGQKILIDGDGYGDYETFFQQMFEIARRHKIMNPEKMRTEYGKLIYLLQDAVSPSVKPHLSISCKSRIETVYKFLEDRDGLALLDDKLINIATCEILAERKSRGQISNEIKRKEKAVEKLKQNYRNMQLSSEDIHLCLYSICDNDSFLNSNRVPIDKVIAYLQLFFSPDKIEDDYSLSIVSGQDGARLSHSHERQYYYALQSLSLWRDIIDDMFRLWAMAEEDLLSESVTYVLRDTGQGMQRVHQSPLTYKSMQQILGRVQRKVRKWIGSNVIHLGDHNVPNALTFIDKYTQVPRILAPIVSCLENLERICEEDSGVEEFVTSGFGGVEQLKKDILYDFFKSAFDGSGADNFYDAGSCIDGRLTSAWNWCSHLPTKPFYCIFKLTGFTGFDGEFK